MITVRWGSTSQIMVIKFQVRIPSVFRQKGDGMKKQIYVALIAVLVLAGTMYGLRAKNSQPQINAPVSIPALEAKAPKRSVRGNTGRLTAEEFKKAHEAVRTHSTRYVLNDVTDANLSIPVTSTSAVIGVFSQDGTSVELRSPNGSVMALQAVEPDFGDVNSRAARKANVGKFVATPLQSITEAGTYTLKNGGKAPITVAVNDNNDLVMNAWLSSNSVIEGSDVELRVKIQQGDSLEAAESIEARLYDQDSTDDKELSKVKLVQDKDGTYLATINTKGLGHFTNIVIDASGVTKSSLVYRRTGMVELIAGKCNGSIDGVLNEKLTKTDLEIYVGVVAKAEGRYYIHANLVTEDGEPIAWAQDARELRRGVDTFVLQFDRSLLPEGKKFVVRDLELTDVSEMPGTKNPKVIEPYKVTSRFF